MGLFAIVSAVACIGESEIAPAVVAADITPPKLFDANHVLAVELTIPPASWAALIAAPREYAPGDVRVGGVWLANIGIRLKGLRSFRALGMGKSAFKIDLNRTVAGQSFDGQTHLTLNNMVGDRSKLHETLFYQVARAVGVPAPRTGYVALSVNGVPAGLYLLVETEDKTMMRAHFGDGNGDLYEGTLTDVDSVAGLEKESGASNDHTRLAQLVAASQAPGDFRTKMSPHLDVDEFLRFAAVEGVGGAEDGYAYGYGEVPPNNYRLYAAPQKPFAFLPWGADASMSRSTSIWGIHGKLLYPYYCNQRPCQNDYVATVQSVLGIWQAANLPAVVDATVALVRPYVVADPDPEHTVADFDLAVADTRAFVIGRAAEVSEQLGVAGH
jgi:spore coat protein H